MPTGPLSTMMCDGAGKGISFVRYGSVVLPILLAWSDQRVSCNGRLRQLGLCSSTQDPLQVSRLQCHVQTHICLMT